ncbi:MAG TPA: hypothetical protein ENL20_02140 [Candidatus Cloacimonetes bacterium]|nr:hypothetical protein [Candidatus Cloacimonadota bacterium]
MRMIKFFNERIKFFSIFDIKLAQLTAMLVMIILIKLIPQIITLDYWIYILALIIVSIRPLYVMFFKK